MGGRLPTEDHRRLQAEGGQRREHRALPQDTRQQQHCRAQAVQQADTARVDRLLNRRCGVRIECMVFESTEAKMLLLESIDY